MYLKLFGAVLIIASCSAAGFQIAANCAKDTQLLKQMITILDYMDSELQYKLTPLPELCRKASGQASGPLRTVLYETASELDKHTASDAVSCINLAVKKQNRLSQIGQTMLLLLGNTLGTFDLDGQISGIRRVKQECQRQLSLLQDHQEERLRSYKTLGVCAGAGLAVILL